MAESYNNSDDEYSYDDLTYNDILYEKKTDTVSAQNMILLVLNIIIFLLGVCGNGVVIWISGLKMKKTVNTTWYLSLAVSDFIFCACLPFTIVHLATSDWLFGTFMCKFTSFVMFLNMFSSIFLLVLISVDRCVSVVFPVWSKNHRTVRAALVLVMLAWVIATVLSIPALIFRETSTWIKTTCYSNYPSWQIRLVIVFSRFVFGFVIPLLIITVSYIIIIHKLRINRMTRSSKPFKVMSALIATFSICWLPYHIVVMMELYHHKYDTEVLKILANVSLIVASANSFLNPLLYTFMGKDFKKTYRNFILSKIANAISEDAHTSTRGQSTSLDTKLSTHI